MSRNLELTNEPGQRRDLLRRFSNPWVGLLTAISSVVAVPLAVYLYFAGARTRRLTYFVSPVKTIVVKGGEASTLRVLHGDQDIKGDVTAAQVAIWNDGTESIRPENVLSPVCILLHPSVTILEAKVRKVSRGVIGAAVDASRLADGVVPVTWKILEHNDGAIIQLIFAGSTETDVKVDGTVEGQPTVLHVKPSHKILSPAEQLALDRGQALVLAGPAAFGVLLVLVWLLVRRTYTGSLTGNGPDRLVKILMWVSLVMLCISLLLAWRELRQPGPPFGF